jgi:hypothetical protein
LTAKLNTNKGRKIRKPAAAANPIPRNNEKIVDIEIKSFII